jgi:hypothetical protein
MSATVENLKINDPMVFRGVESKELNPQEKQQVRAIKAKALEFAQFLETQIQIGQGREVNKARDHLEEAVMWLTKAATREQNGYNLSQR